MRLYLSFLLLLSAPALQAQQTPPAAPPATAASQPATQALLNLPTLANLPNDPSVLLDSSSSSAAQTSAAQTSAAPQTETPKPPPQPKRILGIMPNYRAVSAGVRPPPASPRQAFNVATKQSFDYSAFIFVGLTSAIAEGDDSHPKLGKGIPGFWAYSWRGFLDKTDGNYWVVWALPSVLHEDERYYAMGRGPILKRAAYAATRILITPNYHGHATINGSELIGRAIAQGISTTYYPSSDRTPGALAVKYGYAMLRDVSTNTFREFWPDIAAHLFKHHP